VRATLERGRDSANVRLPWPILDNGAAIILTTRKTNKQQNNKEQQQQQQKPNERNIK
jgi:hypothetical protein